MFTALLVLNLFLAFAFLFSFLKRLFEAAFGLFAGVVNIRAREDQTVLREGFGAFAGEVVNLRGAQQGSRHQAWFGFGCFQHGQKLFGSALELLSAGQGFSVLIMNQVNGLARVGALQQFLVNRKGFRRAVQL